MGKCASRERIGDSLHSRVRKLPSSGKHGETSDAPEESETQPFFVKDRETPEGISARTLTAKKKRDEDELHENLISTSGAGEKSEEALSTVPSDTTEDDAFPEFPVLVPEETSLKQYDSESRSSSSDAAVPTLKYHEVQRSAPKPMQETSTAVPVQVHSQDFLISKTGDAMKEHSHLSEDQSIKDRPFTKKKENIPTTAYNQAKDTHPKGKTQGDLDAQTEDFRQKNENQMPSDVQVTENTQRQNEISTTSPSQESPIKIDRPTDVSYVDVNSSQIDLKDPATPLEGLHPLGTDVVVENLSQEHNTSEAVDGEVVGLENKDIVDQASQALEGEPSLVTPAASYEDETEEWRHISKMPPKSITNADKSNQDGAADSVELQEEEVKDDPEFSQSLEGSEDIQSNLSMTVEPDIDRDIQTALDDVSEAASDKVRLGSAVTEIQEDSSDRDIDDLPEPKQEDVAVSTDNMPELIDTVSKAAEITSTLKDEGKDGMELNGHGIQASTKSSSLVDTALQEDSIKSTEQEQLKSKEEARVTDQDKPAFQEQDEGKKNEELQESNEENKEALKHDADNLRDPHHRSDPDNINVLNFQENQEKEAVKQNKNDELNTKAAAPDGETEIAEQTAGLRGAEEELQPPPQIYDTPAEMTAIDAPKELHDEPSQDTVASTITDDSSNPPSEALAVVEPPTLDAAMVANLHDTAVDNLAPPEEPQESSPALAAPDLETHFDSQERAIEPDICNLEEGQKVIEQDMHIKDGGSKGSPQIDLNRNASSESYWTEKKELKERGASDHEESKNLDKLNREAATAHGETEMTEHKAGLEGAEKEVQQPPQIHDAPSDMTANDAPRELSNELTEGRTTPETSEAPSDNVPDTSKNIASTITMESPSPPPKGLAVAESPRLDPTMVPDLHDGALENMAMPETSASDQTAGLEGAEKELQPPPQIHDAPSEMTAGDAPRELSNELTESETAPETREAPSDNVPDTFEKIASTVTTGNWDIEITEQTAGLKGAEEEFQPPPQIHDSPSERTASDAPKELQDEPSQDAEAASDHVPESYVNIASTITEDSSSLPSEATAVAEPPKLDAAMVPELQSSALDNLAVPEELRESSPVLAAPDLETHFNLQKRAIEPNGSKLEEELEVAEQDVHKDHEGSTGSPQIDVSQNAASESHEADKQEFEEQGFFDHVESKGLDELNSEAATLAGTTAIMEQSPGLERAEEELQPPQIHDAPSEMTTSDAPKELHDKPYQDATALECFDTPGDNVPDSYENIASIITKESASPPSEAPKLVEPSKLNAAMVQDLQGSVQNNLSVPLTFQKIHKIHDFQEPIIASNICNPEERQEVAEQSAGLERAEDELQPPSQIQDIHSEMKPVDAPSKLNSKLLQIATAPVILASPCNDASESFANIFKESLGLTQAPAVVEPPKLDAETVPDFHSSNLDKLSVPDSFQETGLVLPASDVETHDNLPNQNGGAEKKHKQMHIDSKLQVPSEDLLHNKARLNEPENWHPETPISMGPAEWLTDDMKAV